MKTKLDKSKPSRSKQPSIGLEVARFIAFVIAGIIIGSTSVYIFRDQILNFVLGAS